MRSWLSLLSTFLLWSIVLLAGCWDFDALTKGFQVGDAPPADGSQPQDLLQCQDDCSNCTDRTICQPIPNLYAYGELVQDGSCANGESAQGMSFYNSMTPGNTCTGCACGGPTDCSYALQFYKDASCKTPSGGITQVDKNCDKVTTDMNYQIGSATLTCAPDGSNAKVMPGWTHKGQLCLNSTSLSDCTNGPCILKEAGLMPGKQFCVAIKSSNPTCPAGLTKTQTWYAYQDNRTCSCSCSTPTSTTCKGNFDFYTDMGCMMGATAAVTGMCTPTPMMTKSAQFIYSPNSEQCSASGAPQGPSPPVTTLTLCCNM